MRFSDKVVLITGAAGAIGKATSRCFATEGAKLVLVDLNEESLEMLKLELGLCNRDALLLPADVSSEEQVKSFVLKATDTYGRIDVFFNNAGIEGRVANLIDVRSDDFDEIVNVNIKGVFYGLKHVVKVMIRQNHGSIINTSSVAGLKGVPSLGPYVASKHAIIGLTKTAALECAAYGIRINAICPAPINSRMMRSIEMGASSMNGEMAKEKFVRKIPFGRYGEPAEIAELVLFLASEHASFMSGGSYTIDGCLTVA